MTSMLTGQWRKNRLSCPYYNIWLVFSLKNFSVVKELIKDFFFWKAVFLFVQLRVSTKLCLLVFVVFGMVAAHMNIEWENISKYHTYYFTYWFLALQKFPFITWIRSSCEIKEYYENYCVCSRLIFQMYSLAHRKHCQKHFKWK